MKRNKNAHRIVAMLLTVCMLIGILPISGLAEDSVDSTEVLPNYLVDSFSDAQYVNGALYKWAASQSQSADRTVDTAAGALHISNNHKQESDKNNALTYLTVTDSTQDYAAAWTDYTVEAQVKFTGDKLNAQSKVGLVGRVQVTDGVITYYYAYIRNGNKNLFLAKGTINAAGVQTLTSITSKSLGTALEAEKNYTLKVSFNADQIKVYFDGEEQISATDDSYASGSVGIQFTREGEAEVSYIKIIHNSDTTVFMDDFTDSRYLNGMTYQWKADTAGTWAVQDGALSVTTSAVSPVSATAKWNALDDLTNAANKPTSRTVANGNLEISNIGGNSDTNYSNTYLKITTAEGDYASTWTDYSVEMRAKLTDMADGNKHKVSLLGRAIEKPDGSFTYYKVRLRQDTTYAELYECTIDTTGGETETYINRYDTGMKIVDDYMTLKMTFAAGKVYVYVNGSSTACITADAVEGHTAGSVGVQLKRKGVLSVDYIKVTDVTGNTIFMDDFTSDTYAAGVSGYLQNGVFAAGSVPTATSNPSVNFVSLMEGTTNYALAWQNYCVEADMCLDAAASVASLVVRANGNSYYEFRVSDDTAALYKVNSNGESALISKPVDVDVGIWHFAKVEVSGNAIKCYLDGILVLNHNATEDAATYTVGTVGLKASVAAKFDNFAVYPIEAADARKYVTYRFDVSDVSKLISNWNVDGTAWSIVDSKLTASASANATLKNKAIMEDYYAEVKGSAVAGGSFGVIGRCSSDGSNYYLLTADVSAGVQLKKVVGGIAQPVASVNLTELYLLGVKIRPEADYTLRLQMFNNVIEGYIDGVRVIRYEDANALTIGVSGVQGTAGSAIEYLANGKVDAVVKLTVIDENGNAVATASNPWKVTLGKMPDIKLLKLKVEYYDGNSETIFLDTADVQAFVDGTELGSYQSKVEYCGGETVFHYAVVDRGGDIQQLEADLTAFDISNLTLDDETAVNALAARYNNLSYLEKKNISTANKEKVAAALEAIEFIKYPELKGTDIVWKDEFDTVESEKHYISDVEVTARKYTGFWDVENGEMVCYDPDKVDYPTQYSCAASIEGYNWEIRSVTVDIQVLEENAWAGFYFCFRNNEFYKFVVTDKNDRIRLSKNNTLIETINSATVEDPLVFQVGQWYNIRVTMDEGGLIRCYVDDRLWIEYQDVPTVTDDEILTSGTVALSYAENYVKFDNLMVRGKVLGYTPDNEVTYNPNLEATEWADDFNDETAGKSPSHWIELNTEDNWLVEEDRTNLVYGNKDNTTGFSESWLHVFETDVDYTAKLRVTERGYFPVVGLATRINTDESYIRGGYDFTLQKWFIKVRLGKDFEPVTTYADTVDTTVDFTDWVTVRMLVEDKAIKLYVGDSNTPVVTADAGTKVMPGRVGLFAEQCNVQIDDVDLKLLSGQGRVNDGVLEQYTGSTGVTSLYHSVLEMWDENGNQILLLYEDGNQSISTDGGQTFYPSTKYSAAGFRGNSSLELHDGSYLNIKKAGSGEREVFRSDDNGLSWPMVGVVGIDLSVNHAQPAEHINEYQMPDGTWRIFYCLARTATDLGRSSFGEVYYSDDRGATWTKSLTTPYDFSNLSHWSESYVVQIKKDVVDSRGVTLPAGTLINYSSHQTSNSMRYSLSFDNGVTWEGDYAMPHLPGSCHSCCVKEDPYEPGTYYMAFTYNPSGMDEWGFPRYRISLMRSYDGYNWEYLCDVDRWGEVGDGNNGSQMQSINMYLCMTEDKVFVAFSRAEQFSNLTSHNLQYGRLYRFDKDKLEAYDPWPQEYIIPDKSITSIEVVSPKTTYTQGSDFSAEEGKVKVYYYDGTTGLFDLDEAFITEPNLDTLGEEKVVVDFKHFRTIYKINVVANSQSNDNTGANTGDNIDSGNIGDSTGVNAGIGKTGGSDSGSTDVPSQTGDSSQLSLALAAVFASAMALAVIALVGKKGKRIIS